MWKRKALSAEEIEHKANMAEMELDLANSGRENSDSDNYHNSDFKDDDPLFSPNEDDVSETSDFEKVVVRKIIRQGSPTTTIVLSTTYLSFLKGLPPPLNMSLY
ncbi:hypothetical protein FQA39_LY17094 [Lamprigera yunnana]|nr:hypothetical protein FQA39_LY17094 [Lamprigera yunnana]